LTVRDVLPALPDDMTAVTDIRGRVAHDPDPKDPVARVSASAVYAAVVQVQSARELRLDVLGTEDFDALLSAPPLRRTFYFRNSPRRQILHRRCRAATSPLFTASHLKSADVEDYDVLHFPANGRPASLDTAGYNPSRAPVDAGLQLRHGRGVPALEEPGELSQSDGRRTRRRRHWRANFTFAASCRPAGDCL
jgi:hypothetical protein